MDEFVVQGAMEKKFFKVWCSVFRGGANFVALRSISCAIIRRVEGFHLHPRVAENRVFLPHLKYVDERKMSKNRDLGQNILPRSAWVRLSGTGIRFVWRRWTARRRRRSVEPFVQPYNSVNFIELPSSFLCPRNVLIFVPPSGFTLWNIFIEVAWSNPEIHKKIGSAKNSLLFLFLFIPSRFFHFIFKSDPNGRVQRLVTIKFHVFPFMKFLLVSRYVTL